MMKIDGEFDEKMSNSAVIRFLPTFLRCNLFR